jgi:NAD(P)-dependent dehydrogenase (short-subunit alcohol dehydrogenase family)
MNPKNYPEVFSLAGETALITGGGTGLGFGIASCMAAAGAKVVLVGRREPELQAAAAQIGERASYVAHDITRLNTAAELVTKAGAAAGSPISILVNNAGIHLKKSAVDTTPEEFQSVLTTHVCAAHALSSAVLPGMINRGHGNILFTASMTAIIGMPLVIAYSAAKSAYIGMTRALAAEASPNGIRVNTIAPGWIESPMLRKALDGDSNRSNKILGRTPMGRFGDPEDIGWTAVFLTSPAAKFITGAVLPVDGGASMGF